MPDPTSVPILYRAEIWPYVDVLAKMGLAVASGTLVGLEREHRGKAGVRTFALTALLGSIGGMLGGPYGPLALAFVAIFVLMLNGRELAKEKGLALTTSVALTVVGFAGILCGIGHVFTPVAACIVTAAFLAWKEPISGLAGAISDKEVRSAILLAILACVIFPVLPDRAVDPWGLVEPRDNWVAVIAIAAIGFVNYILLKVLGPKGMEFTAFFGGLINSRKVIVELMSRSRDAGEGLATTARRGIALATGAMIIRNGMIVAIFASAAIVECAIPLGLMLAASGLLWWRANSKPEGKPAALQLESPFKLSAALKFGLVFLALNVVGGLANRTLGAASFYVVSVLGGLLSSASSITSAATLIGGHKIPVETGANGIILSSITSVLANVPLIRAMTPDPSLRRKCILALVWVSICGILGVGIAYGWQWFRIQR